MLVLIPISTYCSAASAGGFIPEEAGRGPGVRLRAGVNWGHPFRAR